MPSGKYWSHFHEKHVLSTATGHLKATRKVLFKLHYRIYCCHYHYFYKNTHVLFTKGFFSNKKKKKTNLLTIFGSVHLIPKKLWTIHRVQNTKSLGTHNSFVYRSPSTQKFDKIYAFNHTGRIKLWKHFGFYWKLGNVKTLRAWNGRASAMRTAKWYSVAYNSTANSVLRTGSLPALLATRTEPSDINHGEQRRQYMPHNYMESETTFLYADQVALLYTVSGIVETLTKGAKSTLISVIGLAFGFFGGWSLVVYKLRCKTIRSRKWVSWYCWEYKKTRNKKILFSYLFISSPHFLSTPWKFLANLLTEWLQNTHHT